MIKAIQTQYKGYFFRSRLEARWAVFFDALGIAWEYESEGYELSDGSWYLPDFFLPRFSSDNGTFCEVKPTQLNPEERKKVNMLSQGTGASVLLAVGTPDSRVYELVGTGGDGVTDAIPVSFSDKHLEESYRFFYVPGFENSDGTIDDEYLDPRFQRAIVAARSARFEHGHRGASR